MLAEQENSSNQKVILKTLTEEKNHVQNNLDKKVEVQSFVLEGARKCKKELFMPVAKKLFLSSTYGEVVARAESAIKELETIDFFEDIKIFIQPKKALTSLPTDPDSIEITLKVKEKNWYTFHHKLSDQWGKRHGGLAVTTSSILGGYGEKLAAGCLLKFCSDTRIFPPQSYVIMNATKPILGTSSTVQIGVSTRLISAPESGYDLRNDGVHAGVTFQSIPQLKHRIFYEYMCRLQHCTDDSLPVSLSPGCLYSTKSALSHEMEFDICRPGTGFPKTGLKISSRQEFAGLGGDVGFVKIGARAQYSKLLLPKLTCQVTGQIGALFDTYGKKHCAHDQLYLGGIDTLRNFKPRGVGPHNKGLAIGGNSFYSAGLHLYYKLPSFKFAKNNEDFLHLHAFANAGSLEKLENGLGLKSSLTHLLKTSRLSVGLGLSWKLGDVMNVELNCGVPLRIMEHDKSSSGFQFGVGVSFM